MNLLKLTLMLVTIECITSLITTSLPKNKKVVPKNDHDIQQMLKNMLTNYDPKLRPNYLGPAVQVEVDATIMTISKIDEVNMMYTLDMFFRQRWNDHRLKHQLNETLTLIVGTKQPSDIIWVPDTVFIDSVTSNMHRVTVNNHKIDIKSNGDVFWGTRVTVSPTCNLDLRAYPMDKQKCKFVVLSYAYTSRHLKYEWFNTSIHSTSGMKVSNIRMAQFLLVKHSTESEHVPYIAGNYTQLEGVFHFERQIGFAIMQIYIPSICVVMVSWISLWVQRNAVPARVALCITTLLTISSFWSSINAQLPRVNYVKAIDIFMLTSFTGVITTLVEYTFVLNSEYIWRIIKPKQTKPETQHEMGKLLSNGNRNNLRDSKGNAWPTSGIGQIRFRQPQNTAGNEDEDVKAKSADEKASIENVANKIENCARIFFPLTYAMFLVLYFCYYLSL